MNGWKDEEMDRCSERIDGWKAIDGWMNNRS